MYRSNYDILHNQYTVYEQTSVKALGNSCSSIIQYHFNIRTPPKWVSYISQLSYSMLNGTTAFSNLHFPFKRFSKFATEITMYKDLLNIEF